LVHVVKGWKKSPLHLWFKGKCERNDLQEIDFLRLLGGGPHQDGGDAVSDGPWNLETSEVILDRVPLCREKFAVEDVQVQIKKGPRRVW